MRFSKNGGVMTPLDEVEQVSLSASDPLPSLNTHCRGVAAYEGGQGVMIRMGQGPVKQILLRPCPLQKDPLEAALPNPDQVLPACLKRLVWVHQARPINLDSPLLDLASGLGVRGHEA
jgi:hypothetical protein